jgi:hypothetical protein
LDDFKTNTKYFFLFFIGFFISGFSQEKKDKALLEAYVNFFEAPREQIYVHLNKTTFLEGEPLGFSAYVLDAYKKPSLTATNLYCTITDTTNAIIKKKLVMVQKGLSHNVFSIDSTLPPGNYKFNAYTNWIRNFDEQLHFSKSIEVLGPKSKRYSAPTNEEAKLEIKVLPEGGHLLQNIENVLGILVKNQFGKGVKITSGAIINQSNDTLSRFKLDKFGIGRAILRPLIDEQYFTILNYDGTTYKTPIETAEQTGILLNIKRFFDNIYVKVATNSKTLPHIRDKNYVLSLHNAKSIKTWIFNFTNGPRLELLLEKEDLLPGMNVFTIFDETNTPILERLYFNYNDLPVLEPSNAIHQLYGDSLAIDIKIPKSDPALLNNLSVAVLPLETKAYDTKNNMLSHLFLKPYVKGYIEDAAYYFTDVSKKKLYELDNLLITQGWSSYDWKNIFGNPPVSKYAYEQGIIFKATLNNKTSKNSFLIQPLRYTQSFLFNLNETDNTFEAGPLYPITGEQLSLSEISSSGKLSKASVVPSFLPNNVPELNLSFYGFEDSNQLAELNIVNEFNTDLTNVQELETVEIKAVVKRTRYEKLKKITRGSLIIFDDEKRNAYTDFATFIASKGFIVNQNVNRVAPGGTQAVPLLQIYNPQRTRFETDLQSPLIILDGVILSDLSVLFNFKMDTVDYIEIDKSGATMGMRGANGVIRIVTDPSKVLTQKTFKEVQNIDFPLNFSKPQRYYLPNYPFYDTPFFKYYGVIDWFPDLKLDRRGAISFAINTRNNREFLLVMEGVVNGEYYISYAKTIILN